MVGVYAFILECEEGVDGDVYEGEGGDGGGEVVRCKEGCFGFGEPVDYIWADPVWLTNG